MRNCMIVTSFCLSSEATIVRALFDFAAIQHDDLSFRKGDRMVLVSGEYVIARRRRSSTFPATTCVTRFSPSTMRSDATSTNPAPSRNSTPTVFVDPLAMIDSS